MILSVNGSQLPMASWRRENKRRKWIAPLLKFMVRFAILLCMNWAFAAPKLVRGGRAESALVVQKPTTRLGRAPDYKVDRHESYGPWESTEGQLCNHGRARYVNVPGTPGMEL